MGIGAPTWSGLYDPEISLHRVQAVNVRPCGVDHIPIIKVCVEIIHCNLGFSQYQMKVEINLWFDKYLCAPANRSLFLEKDGDLSGRSDWDQPEKKRSSSRLKNHSIARKPDQLQTNLYASVVSIETVNLCPAAIDSSEIQMYPEG